MKSILIVEDDKSIRKHLAEVFELEGFEVLRAENGQVALDLLNSLDQLPGIIFLDLMMPVMDGHAFLLKIQQSKSDLRFRDIPVVIISAARNEVYGTVVEYLRKPPNIDRLLELAFQYAGH